ncbi:MAG: hypothetical protein KGJ62_09725 [Armatimonadetes bacterium]|nr:hypothetical protein [Armatimonadota bacterium]MDE2205775.1 hypothetical protein [Armatimonadota bacterium]
MTNTPGRMLERRLHALTALMSVALVVLLVQLWLLTIALDDYLAAGTVVAVPAFVASGTCLAINVLILRVLYRVDRGAKNDVP